MSWCPSGEFKSPLGHVLMTHGLHSDIPAEQARARGAIKINNDEPEPRLVNKARRPRPSRAVVRGAGGGDPFVRRPLNPKDSRGLLERLRGEAVRWRRRAKSRSFAAREPPHVSKARLRQHHREGYEPWSIGPYPLGYHRE